MVKPQAWGAVLIVPKLRVKCSGGSESAPLILTTDVSPPRITCVTICTTHCNQRLPPLEPPTLLLPRHSGPPSLCEVDITQKVT